jgi:hypothetical protein
MKMLVRLGLIWSVILLSVRFAGAQPVNNCISCHMETEDENGPAHLFKQDIHAQNSISCFDCHGGDPALDDMDAVRKSKGFRGAPEHLDIPAFCARCHADARYMHDHNPSLPTDQYDKYLTSTHGIRLTEKKDVKVATCVSCHTAHQIGNAKMPYSSTYPRNIPNTCGHCHANAEYMKEYGIPTDQLEHYKKSVHGMALLEKGDLGAPACNSCHGNHGAAPPGVKSLDAVCGMCHAIEARLFDGSVHRTAFEAQGLPLCMTCHSNHEIVKPSDKLIGFEDGQFCGSCHDSGDKSTATVAIQNISAALGRLGVTYDSADAKIKEASAKGMMTTDEEFALKEVDQIRVQARSSIHAFAADSLLPKAEDGIKKANKVAESGAGLVDEYYFRRWGLGIASIFITLLALLLYLKVRSLE